MNYEVKRLKLFEPLNFSIKENSIQDFSNENEEELILEVKATDSKKFEYEIENMLSSDSRANDIMQMDFDDDKLKNNNYLF